MQKLPKITQQPALCELCSIAVKLFSSFTGNYQKCNSIDVMDSELSCMQLSLTLHPHQNIIPNLVPINTRSHPGRTLAPWLFTIKNYRFAVISDIQR